MAEVVRSEYVAAGFRCHGKKKNEVYLFTGPTYLLLDYVQDKILSDQVRWVGEPKGLSYLEIDYCCCAFASHVKNKAYVFSESECVLFDYVKGVATGMRMYIWDMFPFFKGTRFATDLSAAFESSVHYQACIFQKDQYALIDYKEKTLLDGPRKIVDAFPSLRNTIFENGINGAFTSHTTDFADQGDIEAYLFNNDQCAIIRFSPNGDSNEDRLIDGPKKIIDFWPSLGDILPVEDVAYDPEFLDYEVYYEE